MVKNARRTARTIGLVIGLLLALGGVAAGSEKEAGEESAAPAPVPEPAPVAVPEPAPAPAKPPQAEEKPGIKVTPYGRVEMDVIFSSRGTNPLDPRQFNGIRPPPARSRCPPQPSIRGSASSDCRAIFPTAYRKCR
jgi:hypothetical protein